VPGALGDGVKRPLEIEEAPIRKMGKMLVASRDLEEGHVLTEDDVAIKSPADGGLPPYELDTIVGRRLRSALSTDDAFQIADLEAVGEPVAAHTAQRL
jgi:sialic acid synthase